MQYLINKFFPSTVTSLVTVGCSDVSWGQIPCFNRFCLPVHKGELVAQTFFLLPLHVWEGVGAEYLGFFGSSPNLGGKFLPQSHKNCSNLQQCLLLEEMGQAFS